LPGRTRDFHPAAERFDAVTQPAQSGLGCRLDREAPPVVAHLDGQVAGHGLEAYLGLGGAGVLEDVALSPAGDIASLISDAIGVVGFAALGLRLLAASDEAWDQTPEISPEPLRQPHSSGI
jgi:hypothetical protein